jgi:predicted enzyme related to lactoylglutathione lyase
VTSLARIIVSVASLERSLPFYAGALGLVQGFASPELVTLTGDGVEVMLHERPPTPGDAGVAVSFRVSDVDAVTVAAVRAGGDVIDAPADQPWGERQSVLHDPDGHVICLVAPLRSGGVTRSGSESGTR